MLKPSHKFGLFATHGNILFYQLCLKGFTYNKHMSHKNPCVEGLYSIQLVQRALNFLLCMYNGQK